MHWLAVLGCFAGMLAAAEIEDKETVQRSFPGVRKIYVDAVNGSIRVTARPGADAQVTVDRVFRADVKEHIDEAGRDVKLDISQTGDELRLYVDGPFRCHCGDHDGVNFRRRPDYSFQHDFDLRVPERVDLELRTVNKGEIRVERTAGKFDVSNVNGGVEMANIEGSGRVWALNGKVNVTFRKNPDAPSSFGSFNREVAVYFQPDLSADLQLKSFRGNIFTDFPVSYLPRVAAEGERRNGKFIYRSNKFMGARIGSGGPELKFETFNGEIRILKRER